MDNSIKLPLLSVIVPVYKVEAYLDRCVDSIVGQTYDNLEIILVDDGSPDRSGEICDKWAAKDGRVKVIHKENGGLSDARNAGVKTATGDLISFIDSDDWIEPFFFEKLSKTIIDDDCDIVGCEYRICDETNIHNDKNDINENSISVQNFDRVSAMSNLIDNRIQQVVWNKLYKKSVIDGIPFEKGKYHEDEFWSYQVFARVNKYAAIDYVGYCYFQRSDSIMGEKYSVKRLDAVEAKVRRQKYLEENMPELASKGRINLLLTCLYHGQNAIKKLDKEDCKKAFEYLSDTVNKYPLTKTDRSTLSLQYKVWAFMTKVSLKLVCRTRNLIGIGL